MQAVLWLHSPYGVHTHTQPRRYREHINNVFKFKLENEANWFELKKSWELWPKTAMKIQFLQMGQGVAQKWSVTFLKVTHQLPAEIKELKQPVSASSPVPWFSLFQTPGQ